MATLNLGQSRDWPVQVPLAAVWQGGQGGGRFGGGHVPAAAAAFQAAGRGLAAGLRSLHSPAARCRAAADLPAAFDKLGVVDHVAAVADVIQQAVGGLLLGGAAQGGPPFCERLPGRVVPVMFERVAQVAG